MGFRDLHTFYVADAAHIHAGVGLFSSSGLNPASTLMHYQCIPMDGTKRVCAQARIPRDHLKASPSKFGPGHQYVGGRIHLSLPCQTTMDPGIYWVRQTSELFMVHAVLFDTGCTDGVHIQI